MTLTKQARNAIRESGLPFWGLWTNKYKNCRTVKAMVKSAATEEEIKQAISFVEAQLPQATVKFIRNRGYYGSTGLSFIVRVPLQN